MPAIRLTLEQGYWKGLKALKKGPGTEDAIRFVFMLRNGSEEDSPEQDKCLDGIDLKTFFEAIKLDEERDQQ